MNSRSKFSRNARALACVFLSVVFAAASAPALAASAPDLTGLSLEELMSVELPPLSSSTQFQVSAIAVESCKIVASDLAFGNYDPLLAVPTDGASTVMVTCTLDTGYLIGLNRGIGAGATVAARKLTSNGDLLNYSLYQDAARSRVWGETAGTDTVAGIGTGAPVEYQVYGRIPARQSVKRGTYIDTITVSVTF